MTVLHGDEMRNDMLAGIDALADVVKSTLGPRGRYVAMPQKANVYGADYTDAAAPDAPVLVTNNGVTIAKSITLPDLKAQSRADLLVALICAAEDGRDMLIVSDGVEGEALALVLGNNREGGMHVACVDAPEYGEGRRWRLEDLAVQTGAAFIAGDAGMSLAGVTRDMLGTAERVTVTQKRTTITGGGGDPKAIADRVSQLRYYVENTDYEFNRKRHAERLTRFVSGVATIRVGAATEGEQWERKMLVEDVLAAVLERKPGEGYDAARDRCVDMMQAGIIDPLAVTSSALEAALSIAGTALLTEAGIMGKADE